MFELTSQKRREGKDLMSFKRELDNLFNHFFDMDFPMPRRLFKDQMWTPRVDLSEGEKDITVRAEIPGCEPGDIDVSLEGRTLTIKGEKRQEGEEKAENLHRIERAYGFFSRTLELPTEVDQENIKASYKKGVLNLVFRKTEQAKGKKIEIESD